MKLSAKQKEVVKLMQEGWIFIMGKPERGAVTYSISRGMETRYFNATVFKNLLYNDLIWQQNYPPFDYVLTDLGKSLTL